MTAVTAFGARELVRSRWFRSAVRLLLGGAVLVALVVRVGAGPFLRGLAALDLPAVLAATVLSAVATGAAAWRWRLIARPFGAELSLRAATGAYYRSQFLNTVLPGGVVGDVERAVAHGRAGGAIVPAVRAVAVERSVGQLVQVVVTVVVLAFLAPEFSGPLLPAIAGIAAIIVLGLAVTAATSTRARRALRREVSELRAGLGSARVAAQAVFASLVVIACHAATFAVATAAIGLDITAPRMVAIALVVLLGASLPFSVGGWGPREGFAGWAFAVAGFGASAGVAASTLFGVLAIVSLAPGAAIALLAGRRSRRAPA